MKVLEKTLALLAVLMMAFSLAACDANDGPMEEAGESFDEATEDLDDSFE